MLEDTVGQVTPDNKVSLILKDKDHWTVVATYIEGMLFRKKSGEELFDDIIDITED